MASKSGKIILISGVCYQQKVEWKVGDGFVLRQWLNQNTGSKVKTLMEDRIMASAFNIIDDKKSYREGLIDMYRYFLSLQSSNEIKDMTDIERKEFLSGNMPHGG